MQSLPPLLGTIHEQTGIQPPDWLAKMPPQVNGGANGGMGLQQQQQQQHYKGDGQVKKVNGV